jgi:hypothetical protein
MTETINQRYNNLNTRWVCDCRVFSIDNLYFVFYKQFMKVNSKQQTYHHYPPHGTNLWLAILQHMLHIIKLT